MTILFDAARRVNLRRPCASGVHPPQLERLPLGPDPVDSAWYAGYSLGLDGIPADPSGDLSPFQADAFRDGNDKGLAKLEAELDTRMLASSPPDYSDDLATAFLGHHSDAGLD